MSKSLHTVFYIQYVTYNMLHTVHFNKPTNSVHVHMCRLNSGIKNRHNFFLISFFLVQKIEYDSVNLSDSGNIRFLVRFPGNSILKILQNFWKCVGGVYMRGCLVLKITQSVQLFTLINFIYKKVVFIGFHVNPRNFNPREINFLAGFLAITFFRVEPRP